MVTEFNFEQPLNWPLPIDVNEPSIVIDVIPTLGTMVSPITPLVNILFIIVVAVPLIVTALLCSILS